MNKRKVSTLWKLLIVSLFIFFLNIAVAPDIGQAAVVEKSVAAVHDNPISGTSSGKPVKTPQANDDVATTEEDVAVAIGILANDKPSQKKQTLLPDTIQIVSGPDNGTLSLNIVTGVLIFTPAPDFNGTGGFSYTVADTTGAVSNPAAVTVTITPVNDPPRTTDDSTSTLEDRAVTINILANDTGSIDSSSVIIQTQPLLGEAVVDAATGVISYTPSQNANGEDQFSYTVADYSGATSAETWVTVTITPVNDCPVAIDDAVSTEEDTAVTIDILANDSDVDNRINPASLNVTYDWWYGDVSVDYTTGLVTYTPRPDWSGTAVFTYTVADEISSKSNEARVTITVTPVNDLPQAGDDRGETLMDQPVTIDILANDSDIDGQLNTSSITIVNSPAHGTLAINSSGIVTYTPTSGFFGSDSFTYRVSDNEGALSNIAPVTLSVFSATDFPTVNLEVNEDALYRVSYEQLIAAGFDFAGAPASALAIVNRGNPVPIRVVGGTAFGPGSSIDFSGQAADSLYTRTNIYQLVVDPALHIAIVEDASSPVGDSAAFYMEQAVFDRNTGYFFNAPINDPWYAQEMLVYTSEKFWNYTLQVDQLAADLAPAYLDVLLYGGTDWPSASIDHHVTIRLNGIVVADEYFNGTATRAISVQVPAGVLQVGDNMLTLTLPGDTGVSYEIAYFEQAAITYPRWLEARGGSLAFAADGSSIRVENYQSAEIVAYGINGSAISWLSGMDVVESAGGYAAVLPGTSSASYLVAETSAIKTPGLSTPRADADITSGMVDFLIISHPDFITGIQPLVQAREAQGYSVQVVDVYDVYAQFAGGNFDPQAIKGYITYAVSNMGVRYVLLVGDDTYDYLGYLETGSQSFIPTLYTRTTYATYTPSDNLYADIDGNHTPDVALGRFPVRTVEELNNLVAKTLAYSGNEYQSTAIFASGSDTFFQDASEAQIGQLGTGWMVERAFLGALDVATARSALIDAINSGTALTSYFGHASPDRWTYDGLFYASDAKALTNAGRPTVITSFGCWTTYYVTPYDENKLFHELLVGQNGAAAYMGSAVLESALWESRLGELVMTRLSEPGMTIGDAFRLAKTQLEQDWGGHVPITYNWSLLGDPTLVVTP
nr:tandem-95 repeat protein [Anaerolineae bacterium]